MCFPGICMLEFTTVDVLCVCFHSVDKLEKY